MYHDSDLYQLRQTFTHQRILLCFNGPISRSLIEEIGNALRNYLDADRALPAQASDVFGAYIEMTQNIRHYAARRGYADADSIATVAIARDEDGRYRVSVGNVVEAVDGEALLARIAALAALDKDALKAAYKAQLRAARPDGAASGAGLGLIDLARKASAPLAADLQPLADGRCFFSLRAII